MYLSMSDVGGADEVSGWVIKWQAVTAIWDKEGASLVISE
jgi:hypothetical protein